MNRSVMDSDDNFKRAEKFSVLLNSKSYFMGYDPHPVFTGELHWMTFISLYLFPVVGMGGVSILSIAECTYSTKSHIFMIH